MRMSSITTKFNMDNEIQTFFQVWLTAILSLILFRPIATRLPAGVSRLISLLPVLNIFTTLPLRLSSFYLTAATFFCFAVGSFKLLLFSFGQPPLSTSPPLSLLHFVSIATVPISTTLTPKSHPNRPSALQFLLKCLLYILILKSHDYRESIESISPYLISALYCSLLYLLVELGLSIAAETVRATLGLELEPQFNQPYLATSLQDFWGRRWNLVVMGILRTIVYLPVRRISTHIVGRRKALVPAVMATFLVSGLVHDWMYYCLTRVTPTWEITGFFVLHGFCLTVEIWVKKALTGRWQLPWVVSCALTLGFLLVTSGWLYFPVIIRNGLDLKLVDEYQIFVRFVYQWGMTSLDSLFAFGGIS